MTEIEFNEVRKQNGVGCGVGSAWPCLSYINPNNHTVSPIYQWHTCDICFYDNGMVRIKGDIPLELTKKVYDKFPRNIVTETNDYETYDIFTKEDFEMLLIEINNILMRDVSVSDRIIKNYDDEMRKINFNILKKIQPEISTKKWIESDPILIKFHKSHFKQPKAKESKKVNIALQEFDSIVNPFVKNGVNLKAMDNYLSDVTFSVSSYDSKDYLRDVERKNCANIVITNSKDTKSVTSFCRRCDGISYNLSYNLGDNLYFYLNHDYSIGINDNYYDQYDPEIKYNEKIYIEYRDEFGISLFIEYNLTTGTIKTKLEDGKEKIITDNQKEFVYRELLKAIKYAFSITKGDTKEKIQGQKLSLKKNDKMED